MTPADRASGDADGRGEGLGDAGFGGFGGFGGSAAEFDDEWDADEPDDGQPPYQRRLVTLAAADYPDEPPEFAAGIREQVAVVTEWFAPDDPSDPVERDHVDLLDHDGYLRFLLTSPLKSLQPEDALVLYVTGHGRRLDSGRHFIELPHEDAGELTTSGLRTVDLVEWVLASRAEHVLVLIDTCYAGAVEGELHRVRADLLKERLELESLTVIVSADFHERPRVGEFTRLLAKVAENLRRDGGPRGARYLSQAQFLQELETYVRSREGRRSAQPRFLMPSGVRPDLPSPCLPNPGYRRQRELVAPGVRELVPEADELDRYWLTKASGRTGDDDPGWYFSGRAELMRGLTGWLAGGSGVLVVTGSAGSGKSALLARAVLLSDPGFVTSPHYRALVAGLPAAGRPPVGSVDAAVLARGKDPEEVAAALLAALGHRTPVAAGPVTSRIEDLVGYVGELAAGRSGERAAPLTLVVDGLDESVAPRRVVSELLTRLHRMAGPAGPAVRLLVGVRGTGGDFGAASALGPLRSAAAESWTVVRTDGPGITADLAEYVTALLAAPDPLTGASPYLAAREAAADVATAISRAVGSSFLDARLAAQRLRAGPAVQDPHDPHWLAGLAAGTERLLADDLAEVAATAGIPAVRLRAVLRATAFALGDGLPTGEVWRAAAHGLSTAGGADPAAVADPALIGQAVARVLDGRLAGYLVGDTAADRQVYRPAHERLTELLRAGDERAGDPSEPAARRVVAEALCELVRDWNEDVPPHPYLRRHLAAHAQLGAVLDDAHLPAAFLIWESSGAIRGMLGIPAPDRDDTRRLAAWARIEPYALQAGLGVGARRDSFVFSCAGLGVDPGLPRRGLDPHWVRWPAPVNLLAATGDSIVSMCVVRLPGDRTVIATCGSAKGVRLWDGATGLPHGLPLDSGGAAVLEMAVVDDVDGAGGELLAAAGEDGTIRLWDVAQGVLRAEVSTGDTALFGLCALPREGGGLPLLVSGGDAGVLRIWDPQESPPHTRLLGARPPDRPAAEPASPGSPDPPAAGRGRRGDGRGAASDGRGTSVDGPQPPPADGPSQGPDAAQPPDGPSQAPDGTSPPLDGLAGRLVRGAKTARTVARLLRASPAAETVRPALGRPSAGDLTGPGPVGRTAADGGDAQQAGEGDGPGAGGSAGAQSPVAVLRLLALPRAGGPALVVEASRDTRVRVWDAVTGRLLHTLTAHTLPVTSLAAVPLPGGGRWVASGSRDKTVRLWDPLTGEAVGKPYTAANKVMTLATVTSPGGRVLLAVGDSQWEVTLYDPLAGETVGPLLTGHRSEVRALSPLSDGPGRLLVGADQFGDVRLWPVDGTQLPGGLPERFGRNPFPLVHLVTGDGGAGLLATATDEDVVRLWQAADGEPAGTLPGQPSQLLALPPAARGGDGRLVLGFGDGTVALVDPLTRRRIAEADSAEAVESLCLLPGPPGQGLLAVGHVTGGVRLFTLPDLRPARTAWQAHRTAVGTMAVVPSRDGRTLLATAAPDGAVALWDPATGHQVGGPLREADPAGGSVWPGLAVLTVPGGGALLASSRNELIDFWDPERGELAGEPLTHPGGVRALAAVALPDGRSLLVSSGAKDEGLWLWDPVTRQPVSTVVIAGLLYGLDVRPGTAARPPWVFVAGRGLACFQVVTEEPPA